MSGVLNFYPSTVGKKISMALSGLILVGFVLSHMVGNLKIFGGVHADSGRYAIDEYAEALRAIGSNFLGHETFLWGARLVLLGALVLHVTSAIWLARHNSAAKPVPFSNQNFRSANAASRSMKYGGLFLLTFIIFHILHFTTGTVHTEGFVEGQVYANIWHGFQLLPVTAFYVIAMGFLSLHLFHGFWSMFQTLGVTTPGWNDTLRLAAKGVAVALFVGFTAVPIAASLKLLPQPMGQTLAVVGQVDSGRIDAR